MRVAYLRERLMGPALPGEKMRANSRVSQRYYDTRIEGGKSIPQNSFSLYKIFFIFGGRRELYLPLIIASFFQFFHSFTSLFSYLHCCSLLYLLCCLSSASHSLLLTFICFIFSASFFVLCNHLFLFYYPQCAVSLVLIYLLFSLIFFNNLKFPF